METVEIQTLVYLPPEEVFEFLLDFPGYARYSKYLRKVDTITGNGGPGTEYALQFQWWRLSYTARSAVTEVSRPNRIDWRVTEDIDARGHWRVESVSDEVDNEASATRVTLKVDYQPESVGPEIIEVPRLVSFRWILNRVTDLIVEEGERVVTRIVADLEGERRDVELSVQTHSDS